MKKLLECLGYLAVFVGIAFMALGVATFALVTTDMMVNIIWCDFFNDIESCKSWFD